MCVWGGGAVCCGLLRTKNFDVWIFEKKNFICILMYFSKENCQVRPHKESLIEHILPHKYKTQRSHQLVCLHLDSSQWL